MTGTAENTRRCHLLPTILLVDNEQNVLASLAMHLKCRYAAFSSMGP